VRGLRVRCRRGIHGDQSGGGRARGAACRLARSATLRGLSGTCSNGQRTPFLSFMDPQRRVVSGMRPNGRLHLGHYHGVLKSWVRLQHEYQCFLSIVDWHALATDHTARAAISRNVMDMGIDWLAAGVSPSSAVMFIQSQVPEHAELHLLLSMVCPLGWLERVPSYKESQQDLQHKDLATYGYLGYPLLQAADILAYRAGVVPVGAD